MSGTDRVAMATLAVNVLAGVLLDGVVASQFDGAVGYKPGARTCWAKQRANVQEDQRSREKMR